MNEKKSSVCNEKNISFYSFEKCIYRIFQNGIFIIERDFLISRKMIFSIMKIKWLQNSFYEKSNYFSLRNIVLLINYI